MIRALAIALVSLAVAPAVARAKESPRSGSFELRIVPFRPNLDAEFGGAASPYQDAFGSGKKLMIRGDVSRSLLKQYGTLDLGLGLGYFQARGRGRLPDGSPSGDATALRVLPTSLSLTYRLDVFANRLWVPIAPYARVAFERYNWWATRGSGGTASANGRSGSGATNGYTLGGGVALLLDAIDPGLALEMDRDTGINHSYVYVEASKSKVDDFGSRKSFDLSPDSGVLLGFGLLFVY